MFLSLKITKQSCRKQTKLAIKNLEVVSFEVALKFKSKLFIYKLKVKQLCEMTF